MIKHTQLSDALDIAQEEIKYDEHVKNVLSNKYILANIMQNTIDECHNMTILELVASIEGTPEVQHVPINPGRFPETITGDNTECKIPNEGENTYDIRFHALIPGIQGKIKLLINVEAQNDFTPGYNLVTRGIFYAARMISAQKNTEFTGDNYDDIKNVYSIWVCINVPNYVKNTITRYQMQQKKIFGNFQAKARYDILSVTFICLGTEPDETQQKLLSMLETIFSESLDLEDKKHILEEEYSLPMTIELGKELKQMGSWGEYFFEKGSKRTATENAKNLLRNGASYELVRASIETLTDEELQEIYDEVMSTTV